MIEFSHRLGKTIVAEGVQSEEQFQRLKAWGCDQCKGQAIKGALSFRQVKTLMDRMLMDKQRSMSIGQNF